MKKKQQNERLERAREMVALLEAGEESQADRLLEELGKSHESNLFQQLGKLTRELHEAISNFQVDSRIADLARDEIPDARERLNHVVSMTEEAAHKTLGAVERSLPLVETLGGEAQRLDAAWKRFRAREMSAEEFRELSRQMDEFLARTVADSDAVRVGLTDVMMAQGAQDLTGQIIRRVVSLVQELEEKLVELVRITGMRLISDTAEVPLPSKGFGPAVPHLDQGTVKSQDEVDDLLSSLGF